MIQHPGFKSCYSKLRLACNLTQPTSPRLTDGTLIDGNDSKLSRILFTSVHGRDRVGLSPLCDLSWLRDRKTGLRRPVNPLNIGQIVNNADGKAATANVAYHELNLDLGEMDHRLRLFLPNIRYESLGVNSGTLRLAPLIATRDVEAGEELFSSYFSMVK